MLLFYVNISEKTSFMDGIEIKNKYYGGKIMIKYPLYVTLDTNIFDANKLDFGKESTLGLLVNYVEAGKIKIVLSNIVIKEVEKHVIKSSDSICSAFRELRKKALSIASEGLLEQVGIKLDALFLNKIEYQEKCLGVWNKFLESLKPEIMDLSLVDLKGIVDDYFEFNPPFENSEKKRKEFPDAFIANQIRERFGKDEIIAIISNDKGFKKACGCSENHVFFASLGELYNTMNRQEKEYKTVLREINSLIANYTFEIRDAIKNEEYVEVHGLSYDKDGIESGFNYTDFEVTSIKNISCHVKTIDEITDEIALATLVCTADVEVECSYEDYDNAAWDSETKTFYFLETRINVEKHSARFGIRVELDRSESELRIIPFKVILNGDTLYERFEVREDEELYDEMDIINQDREDLGLCSLDKYADYLEDDLVDSLFMNDIVEKFEKINELYQEYDTIAAVYDELLSVIKDTESKDIVKQLTLNLKDITGFPVPADINDITAQEKDEIIYWVDQSYERLYKLSEQKGLPDNFKYGDTIEIQNGLEKYQFNIGEFSGIATAGDQEDIDLSIKNKDGEIIGKGRVSLTVGYIDFDEDGCAGNGIDDSIEYCYEDIVKALENIAELIEQDIKNEGNITKKIEKVITTE